MAINVIDFTQEVIERTINQKNANGYEANLDIRNGYKLEVKKDGKTVAKFKDSYQTLKNWFKLNSFTYSSETELAYDNYGKTDNSGNYEWIDKEEYLEAEQEFLNLL